MSAVPADTLPVPSTPQKAGALAPASQADARFNLVFRQAKALSSSQLVPQAYRDNIPNTMLALDIADRIGASAFAVMQNLHIIQGRPSWSSTFLIGSVNHTKRFEPLRFEIEGTDPFDKGYRVRAYAKDRESQTVCCGAWINWKMVEAEGWSSKSGSKWKSMPEQMFLYRAAAFWARVYAPEVCLGLHTADEMGDVYGGPQVIDGGSVNSSASIGDLKQSLLGQDSIPPADNGEVTFESIKAGLEAAGTRDALDEASSLIGLLSDPEQRKALVALYDERFPTLAE
ncbi:recombinase RecT [Arenimonas sp.]|uniref:recombinase RecT n=1 Tax=Arenimonas sp. TaxID=1872635 RepID=UPI0039E299EB